jgi:hypothetical protein
MYVTAIGQRKTERPKARWKEVSKDASRNVRNKKLVVYDMNRIEWRELLRESKTLTEL